MMELTFKQTMNRLRIAQESNYSVTFQNMDHVEGLSKYSGDVEIKESRRFIHMEKEKWYLAPEGSDDMVYCYIERMRGQHVTAFNLYREDTGEYMLSVSFDKSMTGIMIFHTIKVSRKEGGYLLLVMIVVVVVVVVVVVAVGCC